MTTAFMIVPHPFNPPFTMKDVMLAKGYTFKEEGDLDICGETASGPCLGGVVGCGKKITEEELKNESFQMIGNMIYCCECGKSILYGWECVNRSVPLEHYSGIREVNQEIKKLE